MTDNERRIMKLASDNRELRQRQHKQRAESLREAVKRYDDNGSCKSSDILAYAEFIETRGLV